MIRSANLAPTTLLLLFLVSGAAAQQAARPAAVSTAGTTRDSGGGEVLTTSGAFFGLSVPDLEASIRWYSEKLGLRITLRPPAHEGTEVALLEGGGLMVELIRRADAVPLGQVAPQLGANYVVHGYFKAGVVVDDFEATLAVLRSRGVEIAMGPFPARPGQRANVLVRDNAGNLIQFFGK
jgi:catechol 2,3-dioxygenase-like lactoylglutathione lyase family enzyme